MTDGEEKRGLSAARPSIGAAESTADGVPLLASEVLFGGARELIIRHGGEHYRLRQTKSGKLLLIK